jgi:hypothetical protein
MTRWSPYTVDDHCPMCALLDTLILTAVEHVSKASFSFSLTPCPPLFVALSSCTPAQLFTALCCSSPLSQPPVVIDLEHRPLLRVMLPSTRRVTSRSTRTSSTRLFPPRIRARRRRLSTVLLQSPNHVHEHRRSLWNLFDPQATIDDLGSASPTSFLLCRLAPPSPTTIDEPLATLYPKSGPLLLG